MNEHDAMRTGDREREGFDFVGILALLLQYKKWILWCTFTFGALGVIYALLAPPVFTAGAIIALKERDAAEGASRLFSQFGSLGGVAGSNTSLNKIGILVESHELTTQVIRENNLLPILFPKRWDAKRGAWKPGRKKPPTIRDGVRVLKGRLTLDVQVRKGVVRFSVDAPTAALAKSMGDMYLKSLSDRIRVSVMSSADADRRYLEAQLEATMDPILREKIQNMIVLQIEKSMLVSSQGFEVLEGPVEPQLRTAPQRRKIVQASLLAGFVLSVLAIYGWRGYGFLRASLRERKLGNRMEKTK